MRRNLVGGMALAAAVAVAAVIAPRPEDQTRQAGRGIEALIVGGVLTAVVLSQDGSAREPSCPAGATCPLN